MPSGRRECVIILVSERREAFSPRLQGFATGASFSRAASMAANDALEKFAEDGPWAHFGRTRVVLPSSIMRPGFTAFKLLM